MIESGADLVVANDQNEIVGDKHSAYLINSQKEVESGCETKQDIASNLMDLIAKNCNRLHGVPNPKESEAKIKRRKGE